MVLSKLGWGLRGTGLKSRLLHPVEELWDLRLGVRTSGFAPALREGSIHYVPTPYAILREVLGHLDLGPGDVFVDLGCGLGRPLMWAASHYAMTRALGVELNPELAALAKENAEALRRPKCPIEIVQADAGDYDYPEVTALFMYHPFLADTMRQVLERLRESVERAPRELRIAYLNPLVREAIDDCGWLELTDEWEPGRVGRRGEGPAVEFWRSTIAR